MGIEIERLVGVAHPYVPAEHRHQLVVNVWCAVWIAKLYRLRKAIQCHLLAVDTSTVAGTVLAIEEYLTVGGSNCAVCKAVGEGVEPTMQAQRGSISGLNHLTR